MFWLYFFCRKGHNRRPRRWLKNQSSTTTPAQHEKLTQKPVVTCMHPKRTSDSLTHGHLSQLDFACVCCQLSTQSMLKNMTMQHFEDKKGGELCQKKIDSDGTELGHIIERKPIHFEILSSIFFHSSCFLFVFVSFSWQWEAQPPIVRSSTIRHSWYNDSHYPFNVISILLLLLWVYCLIYDLITYAHVCYRIYSLGNVCT